MISTPVLSIASQLGQGTSVLSVPGVPGQFQIDQDFGDGVATVEDVKMDARHAVVPEFPALLGGVLYAQLSDGIVVFRVSVQLLVQLGRNFGPAQGGEPAYLGCAEYGQHPRNDRHIDPSLLCPVYKLIEIVIVVEKLSYQEVGPLFD